MYFRVAKDELKPIRCIVYIGEQLMKTCTWLRSGPAFTHFPHRLRGAPAGLAQVRAQTPSLIALPRSETVYMGGAVWGPITSLNLFSPFNSQLDDYLQSMVYLPLFLFSPVTGRYVASVSSFTVILRKGSG